MLWGVKCPVDNDCRYMDQGFSEIGTKGDSDAGGSNSGVCGSHKETEILSTRGEGTHHLADMHVQRSVQ